MFNEQYTGVSAGPLMVCEAAGLYRPADEAEIMGHAERILRSRICGRDSLTSCAAVKAYLRTKIGHLDHEVFVVLYLNCQHRLLDDEELFRGTLSQTSVYPRDAAQRGCRHLRAQPSLGIT